MPCVMGDFISNPQAQQQLARHAEAGTGARGGLVDVKMVAEYLGVSAAWVYEHADELGARRLGKGPKARLRFSLLEVDSRLTVCSESRESGSAASSTVEPKQSRRSRTSLGSKAELLPIRGRSEAA